MPDSEPIFTDYHQDGVISDVLLRNLPSGQGTGRDKSSNSEILYPDILSHDQLRALYRNSDLCSTVVDAMPEEMSRKWIELRLAEGEPSIIDAFYQYDYRLDIRNCFQEAQRWANLFGGCLLIIGADDGRKPEDPLDESNIKSIKYLKAVDRWHLMPAVSSTTNINLINLLDPEFYQLNLAAQQGILIDFEGKPLQAYARIHKTRVLRFDGNNLPYADRLFNQGWHDSVLQRFFKPWKTFMEGLEASSEMLISFDTFVHQINGLSELIKGKHRGEIQQHMADVHLFRSVYRVLLLDGDIEKGGFVSRDFGEIPEILDRFERRVTAASGLPHYILWGYVAKVGLADSGNPEERAWAQQCHRAQEGKWRRNIDKLRNLIFLAKDGPTNGVIPQGSAIIFRQLLELTDLEEMEKREKQSRVDAIYLDRAVITPQEARQRFQGINFSYELQISETSTPPAQGNFPAESHLDPGFTNGQTRLKQAPISTNQPDMADTDLSVGTGNG